jgi:hypothetical protein
MSEPLTFTNKLGHVRRLRPLRDRWEAKVDRDGPIPEHAPELGPCWVWTGTRLGGPRGGYGAINRGGQGSQSTAPLLAHVVAYELYVGPVPDGLELDHLCGNKGCVNPSHLEPVTHRENIRRGFRRRREARAA